MKGSMFCGLPKIDQVLGLTAHGFTSADIGSWDGEVVFDGQARTQQKTPWF